MQDVGLFLSLGFTKGCKYVGRMFDAVKPGGQLWRLTGKFRI